jgi:hypothetical protein
VATKIGSLLIRLGLDSAEFKTGLSKSEKELRKSVKHFKALGGELQNFGAKLSIGISAPFAALGAASVKGFIEQEKAIADVSAALASMGNVSGKTAGELSAMADKLELSSLFDAEVILKQVTAQLLTFGNVAGREFDRAQQAAVDMATRLGGEPQAAAIMLGKALNDPVKGISALTRVGVQFTAQQKAQIKAMTEAGNIAGAQGVILAEVERQFRGAAQAAADASPWRKAQVQIGQAMDKIGEAILPAIGPIADAIAAIAGAFASLPSGVQTAIVVFGGLAAVLGPVIFGVGTIISTFSTFFATMSAIPIVASLAGAAFTTLVAVLGSLAAPLAALAAVGVLIYANWETIGPVLGEFWEQAKAALGPPLQELIATISGAFEEFWNGPLGDGIRGAIGIAMEFHKAYASVFGTVLLTTLRAALAVVVGIFQQIGDAIRVVNALLNGDFKGAWEAAARIVARAAGPFADVARFAVEQMQKLYAGVKTWLMDKLGAVFEWVGKKVKQVGQFFYEMYDAVVGHSYVPDMVDGIAAEMKRLDAIMVDPAKKATTDTKQAFRDMAGEVQALLDELFPQVAQLRELQGKQALIGRARDQGMISSETANAALFQLSGAPDALASLKDWLTGGVKKAIDEVATAAPAMIDKVGAALAKIPDRFADLKAAGSDAFNELGFQLSGVLQGAQSLGDALRNLLAQLADMAFNLAWKALGASIGIPGFATGTLSAPRGLALVGERGPELVNFRGGERVFDNANTRQMLGGGGAPINITIHAPNERVGREAAGQAATRLRHVLNGR